MTVEAGENGGPKKDVRKKVGLFIRYPNEEKTGTSESHSEVSLTRTSKTNEGENVKGINNETVENRGCSLQIISKGKSNM